MDMSCTTEEHEYSPCSPRPPQRRMEKLSLSPGGIEAFRNSAEALRDNWNPSPSQTIRDLRDSPLSREDTVVQRLAPGEKIYAEDKIPRPPTTPYNMPPTSPWTVPPRSKVGVPPKRAANDIDDNVSSSKSSHRIRTHPAPKGTGSFLSSSFSSSSGGARPHDSGSGFGVGFGTGFDSGSSSVPKRLSGRAPLDWYHDTPSISLPQIGNDSLSSSSVGVPPAGIAEAQDQSNSRVDHPAKPKPMRDYNHRRPIPSPPPRENRPPSRLERKMRSESVRRLMRHRQQYVASQSEELRVAHERQLNYLRELSSQFTAGHNEQSRVARERERELLGLGSGLANRLIDFQTQNTFENAIAGGLTSEDMINAYMYPEHEDDRDVSMDEIDTQRT